MFVRQFALRLITFTALFLSTVQFSYFALQAQTTPRSEANSKTPLPSTSKTSLDTPDSIQKKIEQVKGTKDLTEEHQKKAIELYNQAIENVKKTAALKNLALEHEKNSQNASQRLDKIKRELELLKKRPAPSFTQRDDLPQLEQGLIQAEAEAEKQNTKLSESNAEIAHRVNRQKAVLTRVIEIDEKLKAIELELKAPINPTEPAVITSARKTELATLQNLLKTEKPALKNELTLYEAEAAIGFPRIEQDYFKLKTSQQKAIVDALKEQIKKRRTIESEKRVEEARARVIATHPLLQPLAEQNQIYAEEIRKLNQNIEAVDKQYSSTSKTLEDLKRQFQQTKEKEKAVGLTGPIGLLLRNQQAALPDTEIRKQNIADRGAIIEEVQLKSYDLDDRWANFPDAKKLTEEIFKSSNNKNATADDFNHLELIVDELLKKQKEYLDTLIRSNKNYFNQLLDLNGAENQLVKQTDEYSKYIQERIFWIKSSAPLSTSGLSQIPNSFQWLTSSTNWKALLRGAKQDIFNNSIIYFTAFCCFLSLVYLAYNVRQQLRIINKEVIRTNYRKFALTARVAFLTLFIAIVWPGLIWFIAWRIGNIPNASVFIKVVQSSLNQVAWLLFFWELIRQICRPLGLGESHFGWYKQTVLYVRKNIRWVIPISIPLLFVILLLNGKEVDRNQDLLERLFFVALLVVYTVFSRRVFHPQSGLFQSIMNYNQEVWYDRCKYIIYFLSLIIPCSLILLTLIGFYFTAMSLFHLLFLTLWLFLVVILLRAFLLRWILIRHRQLSFEQNQERLQALREESKEAGELAAAGISIQEEDPADLTKISSQIKKLINATLSVILLVGLLWIWGETLPAFNRLDSAEYKIWSTSIQTVEETKDAEGNITQKIVDKLEPVTYFDIGLAIIFTFFAVIATKNIPGLLEFVILQRLPLDSSVKYAITSLARYFVALVGIFAVFNTIGIGWSKTQWLATALTFGLAFGLQEIFANFVSGLILLIERPIRVGDIITIDQVTGVVSRIRMRATTITNWDRKEYIVPNKEFITGKLLNWTLSDSVNRILINVGVAYGTDTNKVSELALKILNDHPLILSDPSPSITFESFGESVLNLNLRAYLPNLENRLGVIHELHTSIHEQFNEAGIEIAFPQQDIHLYMGDKSLTETILNSATNDTLSEN